MTWLYIIGCIIIAVLFVLVARYTLKDVFLPSIQPQHQRNREQRRATRHKHDWKVTCIGTWGNDDRWTCMVCGLDGGDINEPNPKILEIWST